MVVSQNTLEIKLFDTLIVFRTTHDWQQATKRNIFVGVGKCEIHDPILHVNIYILQIISYSKTKYYYLSNNCSIKSFIINVYFQETKFYENILMNHFLWKVYYLNKYYL
jgi:hypothetical protein